MKKLSRLRLINWYHIQDETLPVTGSALFMGDNGSGKSTILDAIQLALVADLTQVRFNQAANENAARSLQGYTRWMTNSEGSRDSHQYRRGTCSTYILLEFTEAMAGGPSVFTVGVVIDSFADGADPHRLHFAIPLPVSEIPVFRGESRHPLNTTEFRKLMSTAKGFFASREPGAFRDDLLIRLGRLSPDFTKILVKAQAFKPLGHVQQFVMDFLLDPRPLETQSLQANLSHYKALEQKAVEAEKRIQLLETIAAKGEEVLRVRDEIALHRYLELRAQAGIQEARIALGTREQGEAALEKTRLQNLLRDLEQKTAACELQLGSVYRALSGNAGWQERERLKADLSRTEGDLKAARQEVCLAEDSQKKLHALVDSLKQELKDPAFDPRGILTIPALPDDSGVSSSETADPAAILQQYSELIYGCRSELDRHKAELQVIKSEGDALRSKLESLNQGVRSYPKEAEVLKGLIEDQLDCEAPLFCELIEINQEHWQPAAEGYLNTRRFDLVLKPKYFSKALSLYEKMKVQLHLHGVGLVDSEKVLATTRAPKPGSLAHHVVSENPWAKAYADFLLGDLICCESEKELRKHSRSITPTCMVYQNHAARQTDFRIFESWHIGSRGHTRQIEQTKNAIDETFEKFKRLADQVNRWQKVLEIALNAEQEVRRVIALIERRERVSRLEAETAGLRSRVEALASSELAELEKQEVALRHEKEQLASETKTNTHHLGRIEERVERLARELGEAQRDRDLRFAEIALEYGSEKLRPKVADFEKRYEEELQKRTPDKVREVYEIQRKNRESRRSNLHSELAELRTEYNNTWGFGAPAQGEDISPYQTELDSWRNSLLPDYRQKILKAKDSAMQELMEDIVHKLRENLDLIPNQFEQINRALRGFHFGHDQYQFTYQVKTEFRAFEKLIREAATYEQQPLFETNWRERFKDGGALEALFENLVQGSTSDVKSELEQYSDYREYYEYDLKILHADGSESYYSKVNRWKSGGETQTPYYIAVLASLYRLYRLQPEQTAKQRGTIGLVILDEAFNKMDEDHLRATLEFTRKLGLQLIMATPKERAEFIIPHVETCYIVAKDPMSGLAYLQDFHQDLPLDPLEESLPEIAAEVPV